MGRSAFLGMIGLGLAASANGEAAACVWLPTTVVEVGKPQSEWERRAEEKRFSAQGVRQRRLAAERAWAAGVDGAAELADILIPNVRPVPIRRSSCGVENEIDHGEGEERHEDWLAGTRFAGKAESFPRVLRHFDGETLGPTCNAEVRSRFAAFLGSRLTARQLRASYIFLIARGPDRDPSALVQRMMAFRGVMRRPPVHWLPRDRWQGAQIIRWTSRHPTGRALQAAVDAFWRENEPLLGSVERTCPVAAARWSVEQARLVSQIEADLNRRRAAMKAVTPQR